jgi:hypothetical protein
LAIELIARTPERYPPPGLRDRLRTALREEQWGEAVELWMRDRPEVDVDSSYKLYTRGDVELASMELNFTPLFED